MRSLRFRQGMGLTLAAVMPFVSAMPVWAQSKGVDPFVYAPYSATANPRLTAKWGADALFEINLLRKDAALKVARDRVATAYPRPSCRRGAALSLTSGSSW